MRLLDTTTFELSADRDVNYFKQQGYAILSHCWYEGGEIEIHQIGAHAAELRSGRPQATKQLEKIRGACDTARRQHGLKWLWDDTCCIDKKNLTELDASIRSMFKWYEDATVCIAYLSDVQKDHQKTAPASHVGVFRQAGPGAENPGEPTKWVKRGWTLQELLAPTEMNFYDHDWQELGTRLELADELEKVTKIDANYLTGKRHFTEACVATKMSWMAGRQTTKVEDMAYSMLGIFGIEMSRKGSEEKFTTAYGEELDAFTRLQELIMSRPCFDESLFAWKMPKDGPQKENGGQKAKRGRWGPHEWDLLAQSPKWFSDSRNLTVSVDGEKALTRAYGSFEIKGAGYFQVPRLNIELKRRYWQPVVVIPLLNFVTVLGLKAACMRMAKEAEENPVYPLNCWQQVGSEHVRVQLYLRPAAKHSTTVCRVRSTEFAPDTKKTFTRWTEKSRDRQRRPFHIAQFDKM